MICICGAGRLQVEVLRFLSLGGSSDRSCNGRGGQQKKGCEELHLDVLDVIVLVM